jgi:hypothetical protein
MLVVLALLIGSALHAQTSAAAASARLTADYPTNRAGILVQNSGWVTIADQIPTRTKPARVLAASLSNDMVPVRVVAEYDGDHASARIAAGQPVICICRFFSLPGKPVLVRLHSKKGVRELDGGRMIVYPVAGGAKTADANKSDVIAVDVSQPEGQVWLVRPQSALVPGEYALMFGTQDLSIFPFTVQ